MVIEYWQKQGCESHDDTLKMASLIEWFVPYFPMGHHSIKRVFEIRLEQLHAALMSEMQAPLTWGNPLLDFLVSKVCLTYLVLPACTWTAAIHV